MNFSIKIMITLYIIFVLFLSLGCKDLNDMPIKNIYVVDVQNSVCSKRVVTDKTTLASKRVADLPLEACDGIIGITAKEFSDLRTFMKGTN